MLIRVNKCATIAAIVFYTFAAVVLCVPEINLAAQPVGDPTATSRTDRGKSIRPQQISLVSVASRNDDVVSDSDISQVEPNSADVPVAQRVLHRQSRSQQRPSLRYAERPRARDPPRMQA